MIGAMDLTTLLVTGQWGLVTIFVTLALALLIPHATQSRQNYLNTGTDAARRQAVRWVGQIQGAGLIVLAALAFLSGLGLADVARDSPTPRKWVGACVVLFLPVVLAHVGFLVLAFRGVRPVPPLRALRLRPAPTKRRPSSPAAWQRGPITVVRFLNTRATDVYLCLLSDTGTIGGPGAGVRLPPGQEWVGSNSAGMLYLIRDREDDRDNLEHDLYVVTAPATPGQAIIPE